MSLQACRTIANKTGNFISVGLDNDHTVSGTVVGVFNLNTLVLSGVAITVGVVTIPGIPFYWVDCSHIAWFN